MDITIKDYIKFNDKDRLIIYNKDKKALENIIRSIEKEFNIVFPKSSKTILLNQYYYCEIKSKIWGAFLYCFYNNNLSSFNRLNLNNEYIEIKELPADQTLEWCKRLQKYLNFKTSIVPLKSGQKKYYRLYLPEMSRQYARHFFNKEVKA